MRNLVIRCDHARCGQRSLAPEENWWSRTREPSLDGRSFELCKRSVHTYHRQIIYARTDDPDVYSTSEHMFSFGPVTGSPPPVIISPSINRLLHRTQCHCATIFRNVIAIAHNRLHHQSALHVLFVCFVSYQFTRYSTAMVHLYFLDTQGSDELACWSHVSVKERSCDGPFASFPIVQYCQSLGCRRLGTMSPMVARQRRRKLRWRRWSRSSKRE